MQSLVHVSRYGERVAAPLWISLRDFIGTLEDCVPSQCQWSGVISRCADHTNDIGLSRSVEVETGAKAAAGQARPRNAFAA